MYNITRLSKGMASILKLNTVRWFSSTESMRSIYPCWFCSKENSEGKLVCSSCEMVQKPEGGIKNMSYFDILKR